jgi:sarcosine oxidase subunit gamma
MFWPRFAIPFSSIPKECVRVAEALVIEQQQGFGLATMMARKGSSAQDIGTALDLDLASAPRCSTAGALTLIGTGPDCWLTYCKTPDADWLPRLRERLGSHAALSDQSGGYAIFRLSGPGARTVLQRGASIDFDPDTFPAGSVAVTVISHIGVIIWADDDGSYEVAVFRSFADSFRHWLDVTALTL